jgi:hypothetical protein
MKVKRMRMGKIAKLRALLTRPKKIRIIPPTPDEKRIERQDAYRKRVEERINQTTRRSYGKK